MSSDAGQLAEEPWIAARNAAVLSLLYGSGLRASELVGLPRRAWSPDRPYLIVRGKGDKERLVPVSDRARMALSRGSGFLRGFFLLVIAALMCRFAYDIFFRPQ